MRRHSRRPKSQGRIKPHQHGLGTGIHTQACAGLRMLHLRLQLVTSPPDRKLIVGIFVYAHLQGVAQHARVGSGMRQQRLLGGSKAARMHTHILLCGPVGSISLVPGAGVAAPGTARCRRD